MPKVSSTSEKRAHLLGKLEEVISLLDLANGRGLLRSSLELPGKINLHVVRQAFEVISAYAVFGFNSPDFDGGTKFTPVMYLCVAQDEVAANRIHRLVWSQGVVPLLLIATPSGLQVRRALTPPSDHASNVSWDKISDVDVVPAELISLTAVALRSSLVWRDFAVDRTKRVDKALLEGIVSLSDIVQREQPNLDRAVVHAVIGRFLYLYILLDRRVVDTKWMLSIKTSSGRARCSTIVRSLGRPEDDIVWPAKEVWALFDSIDAVMNGAIFPVEKEDRREISEESLHLIHRVIRHGDRVGQEGRQLSFLNVTFETLRTETISAMYELFLALESDGTKSDDGAFYTPPFLVDYVLDEIDRVEPFTGSCRVLDPAAGSGIFLVGAYRRIIERSRTSKTRSSERFIKLRRLLEACIFGIERNPQAANVCRFSLYLTMLDYIGDVSIWKLSRLSRGVQVFPSLTRNVSSCDVFSLSKRDEEDLGQFTHVVGNPPWGSYGDTASRTNEKRSEAQQKKITKSMAAAAKYGRSLDVKNYPVANKRLSELFIWKIKRTFICKGGVLGILISTKSFVGRSASAFPDAFAAQFALVGIANFSHFRYRLFAEARSPTIALFARNDDPHPMNEVWVYSPMLSSQPIGDRGHLWTIIANSADVETHRLRDFTRTADGWFDRLILRPLDRKHARYLRVWSQNKSASLGKFLSDNGMKMARGGSPTQTGLPEELLLKASGLRRLGVDALDLDDYSYLELGGYNISATYKSMFAGNVLLVPRSMNSFHFVERPIGFSSTFNAIFFEDPQSVGSVEIDLLRAIEKYLMSDVAKYFYALIGRSWILDHARLEKHDLEALPFPIEGKEDDAVSEILRGTNSKITKIVAKRMGFDPSFSQIVSEYTKFRSGYEDSQLPADSLFPPSSAAIDLYRKMFNDQLLQLFGLDSEHSVGHQSGDAEGYFKRILVRFGGGDNSVRSKGNRDSTAFQTSGAFNPYSSISYDPEANCVELLKPNTHVAWTIEQAFADARGVSSTILRSGELA